MPRALVTSELAETLRSIRLQNKITARSLAEHIDKSPAFISKLENGNILSVDTDELYSILQFISRESSTIELADQIYKSLKLKYSTKEIEEQLWFVNYETVKCLLPIPSSLVDDINSRISSLNITRQYLNSRINANEALPQEDIDDKSIAYNQWYHQKQRGGSSQSIKIKLSENQMNAILDREYDLAPYVFVFCILYYDIKIEQFGTQITLTDEQNNDLMQKTTDILNSHKFFSISEKNALIAEKQSLDEIQDLLSSFDTANMEILGDIISGFRVASEHNIKLTNEQLSTFSSNMHWDLGFMLRIISFDYTALERTSFSNKKNLLAELEELISKYAGLSDEQNRIEEY